MSKNNNISDILLNWYSIHKRDLPWRNTQDPYKIWISEIILQQTRIAQGLSYYNRFIERFPSVDVLAIASEQEVLKYWEGLGYYSRARNLHSTAINIIKEYDGKFPNDYNSLLNLKGIGEYTASAISSFSWNLPYPAVDGNVFRFLSRLFAIPEPIDTSNGKKYFTELAKELMDKQKPGLFNQAIMEFGALQCIPALPDCSICPFKSMCIAHSLNSVREYPVKKSKLKTKNIYLNYFHIFDDEYLWIYKRKEGIWKNLFEFPLIETDEVPSFEEVIRLSRSKNWFPESKIYNFKCIIEKKRHILSHRVLYVNFYQIYLQEGIPENDLFLKIKIEDIDKYPVHRLIKYYIDFQIKK